MLTLFSCLRLTSPEKHVVSTWIYIHNDLRFQPFIYHPFLRSSVCYITHTHASAFIALTSLTIMEYNIHPRQFQSTEDILEFSLGKKQCCRRHQERNKLEWIRREKEKPYDVACGNSRLQESRESKRDEESSWKICIYSLSLFHLGFLDILFFVSVHSSLIHTISRSASRLSAPLFPLLTPYHPPASTGSVLHKDQSIKNATLHEINPL